MDFELTGRIVFSKDISGAKADIEKYLQEDVAELLTKGVPKSVEGGGAKIVSWGIEANNLELEIHSDRYVRAHDALLRLRKDISANIGRKHHVGARSIWIDNYVISFDVDNEPLDEVKIPFSKLLRITTIS